MLTYEITKMTLINDNVLKEEIINHCIASIEEVDNVIAPLFKRIEHCDNKYYSLIGANKRVKYVVKPIIASRPIHLIESINNHIKARVNDINKAIDYRNAVTKRSNKLNNKQLNENMLEHIKEIDYVYIG